MPKEGDGIPTHLVIERSGHCEIWRREFGGTPFTTTQFAAADGMLVERFGSIELYFQLEVDAGALDFVQAAAAIRIGRLHVRLPTWLSPQLRAREEQEDGRARIRVTVTLDAPLLGRLVSYAGLIEVAASPS